MLALSQSCACISLPLAQVLALQGAMTQGTYQQQIFTGAPDVTQRRTTLLPPTQACDTPLPFTEQFGASEVLHLLLLLPV